MKQKPIDIAAARDLAGISRTELARRLGWGESRLRHYKNGRPPTADVLADICQALGFNDEQTGRVARWYQEKQA